jgi:hypothetical protein
MQQSALHSLLPELLPMLLMASLTPVLVQHARSKTRHTQLHLLSSMVRVRLSAQQLAQQLLGLTLLGMLLRQVRMSCNMQLTQHTKQQTS